MSQKEFGDGSTDGPSCESAVFLSRATHIHTHVSIVQKKRRRRLIKRNYSKCMVLKKKRREKNFFTSDSKRHTVKHTKAKRKKEFGGR